MTFGWHVPSCPQSKSVTSLAEAVSDKLNAIFFSFCSNSASAGNHGHDSKPTIVDIDAWFDPQMARSSLPDTSSHTTLVEILFGCHMPISPHHESDIRFEEVVTSPPDVKIGFALSMSAFAGNHCHDTKLTIAGIGQADDELGMAGSSLLETSSQTTHMAASSESDTSWEEEVACGGRDDPPASEPQTPLDGDEHERRGGLPSTRGARAGFEEAGGASQTQGRMESSCFPPSLSFTRVSSASVLSGIDLEIHSAECDDFMEIGELVCDLQAIPGRVKSSSLPSTRVDNVHRVLPLKRASNSFTEVDCASRKKGVDLHIRFSECQNRLMELQLLDSQFSSAAHHGDDATTVAVKCFELIDDLKQLTADALEEACSRRVPAAMDVFECANLAIDSVSGILSSCPEFSQGRKRRKPL